MTTEHRKFFDVFTKKLANGDIPLPPDVKKKKISLPERGTLYDYSIQKKVTQIQGQNVNTIDFVMWLDTIQQEEINPKLQP